MHVFEYFLYENLRKGLKVSNLTFSVAILLIPFKKGRFKISGISLSPIRFSDLRIRKSQLTEMKIESNLMNNLITKHREMFMKDKGKC